MKTHCNRGNVLRRDPQKQTLLHELVDDVRDLQEKVEVLRGALREATANSQSRPKG